MLRFLISGLLCLGTFLVANTAPKPKERGGQVLYFPSAVGDKLVYESVRDGKTSEFSLEVIKAETKDHAVIVTVASDSSFGRVTFQYRLSESGIEHLKSGETSYSTPRPLLRLPAKPRDTWTWTHPISEEKESFKVVKEESIEVPAGKFKALRVEMESEEGSFTDWYAVGLGSIRRETSRPGLGVGVRVLKSFTPVKK